MPDIRVCQAAFGTTPHPGSKPVVCLTAPGSLQPAVSCNQRGHDPDDCDPSGSLYQPVAEVPADQAGLSATTVTKIDKLSEDVAIRINATAWSV